MGVTISTHNGSAVARDHNIRNPKVVSKEQHIDPDGVHETWIDEPVRQAYQRLFGDSVKAYNAKQEREDRRIDDYYTMICKDKKKHPVYEMIIGIYGKNDDGTPICSAEDGKEIMQHFIGHWKSRNPNLEIIGAYYHADEQGEPHVHIDYIPVAHGYKKGMDTQTALVKALGEQGFTKTGKQTAQIKWEASENAFLEQLCREYGLTVEHPRQEGRQHLETQEFKLQSRVSELEKATEQATNRFLVADEQATEREMQRDKAIEQAQQAEGRTDKAEKKLGDINAQYDVASQELKKVLDMKGRASEVRKISHLFGETVEYNKTMLDKTRNIGSEAYIDLQNAKKIREETAILKRRVDNKEQEIAPLHQQAVIALEEAEKEHQRAEQLRQQQEELIEKRSKEIAEQAVRESLRGVTTGRTERLESFLKRIELGNGKTAYQLFEEQERQREKEAIERAKQEAELERKRKRNRSIGR